MLFPSLKFIEYSFNGPNNRNKVVEISEIKKLIPEDGADHFCVLFRYESTLKKYVDEHGTVKGHDLPHYPDYITWDIDEKDLETAQSSTLALMGKLEDLGIGQDMVNLSFSGAKGFHVQVPSSLFDVVPHENNAKFMKSLCAAIADGIKLDLSIYDKNRLFRLRNTKNSKSGLYKVNIPPTMLLAKIEVITNYAKTPQEPRTVSNNYSPRKNLVDLWKKAQTVKERQIVLGGAKSVDVPKLAKACIHRILQGVPDGMIHNSAFRLANHFFKQGFPANIIKGILEGWGPLNEVPADEDFRRMASEAGEYDFGCNDDILKSFCSEQCYLFKKSTVDASAIMDLTDQYAAYVEYIKTLKKKCFVTGFDELDGQIRGVAPGEVMIIMAYSGLFKSALLQNLLLNAGLRTGLHHLFFSLEMPVSRVFERSVQMVTETEGYKIENSFKDTLYHEEMYKRLVTLRADRLLVCQKSGLSIEQIKEYTTLARDKYGDIGAIGIDYLGLMSAPGKQDEYSRISSCAENSKHLAKELNIPVIMLAQINRAAATGGDVEKWSAKGSGAIEASADFLIGLQKDESEQLVLRLLKNRKGAENLDYIVEMQREYLKFVKLVPAEGRTKVKVERSSRISKKKEQTDYRTKLDEPPPW
jgi:hypothetical protein